MTGTALGRWIDATILDLARQVRWSYLPPLMVYLAAGVSSLTAIVGTFFIKEYLDLSAAFLAGLTFWAGIPWALKMSRERSIPAWSGSLSSGQTKQDPEPVS